MRKYFDTGKTRNYQFRLAQLNALKKGLIELNTDFDNALHKDLGKGSFENWLTEMNLCIREVQHTVDHLKDWIKDEPRDTPFMVGPATSYLITEPLGVVAILGSWNFPLVTTISPLISAIAAGNVVLFKPSEFSPHTSLIFKRLFARYLDSSAFQCLVGQVEVAKKLTSSKVDLIIFTGSTEKGKLIAAAASKNLVPCILELGGKCPCVIDSSADLEFAALKVAQLAFMNSG